MPEFTPHFALVGDLGPGGCQLQLSNSRESIEIALIARPIILRPAARDPSRRLSSGRVSPSP